MVNVMADLRKDHRKMKLLLDIVEEQAANLKGEGDPDYKVMNEIMNYCVTYPESYHHPKEDIIYRQLVQNGANAGQVADMEVAHEELSGMTHRLYDALEAARKTGNINRPVLASLMDSFVHSYRLHIDAEDNTFFPQAEELLTPADWAAIGAEVAEMKDPLYGESSRGDYDELSHELLDKVEQIVNEYRA